MLPTRKRDREGVRLIAFRQERRRILNETAGARAETPRRLKGTKGDTEADEEREARERRKTTRYSPLGGGTNEIPATDAEKKRTPFAAAKRTPDGGRNGGEPKRGDTRLRPCCIYHIITIIEPRTTRRHLLLHLDPLGADRPPPPHLRSVPTATTANWKLSNTFSLRCSLVLLARNCLP